MTIYNNPHVSRVYLAHVTCRVVAGIIIVVTRPLTVTAFSVRATFVPANSLENNLRRGLAADTCLILPACRVADQAMAAVLISHTPELAVTGAGVGGVTPPGGTFYNPGEE